MAKAFNELTVDMAEMGDPMLYDPAVQGSITPESIALAAAMSPPPPPIAVPPPPPIAVPVAQSTPPAADASLAPGPPVTQPALTGQGASVSPPIVSQEMIMDAVRSKLDTQNAPKRQVRELMAERKNAQPGQTQEQANAYQEFIRQNIGALLGGAAPAIDPVLGMAMSSAALQQQIAHGQNQQNYNLETLLGLAQYQQQIQDAEADRMARAEQFRYEQAIKQMELDRQKRQDEFDREKQLVDIDKLRAEKTKLDYENSPANQFRLQTVQDQKDLAEHGGIIRYDNDGLPYFIPVDIPEKPKAGELKKLGDYDLGGGFIGPVLWDSQGNYFIGSEDGGGPVPISGAQVRGIALNNPNSGLLALLGRGNMAGDTASSGPGPYAKNNPQSQQAAPQQDRQEQIKAEIEQVLNK